MRIPRFYQESVLELSDTVALSAQNHRHAAQVLRLKKGEPLILFNGQGGECLCKIALTDKRKTEVLVESRDRINRESTLEITLALAIIKLDKMDFAIQKAVEMGVTKIQPMDTQRSVVKLKTNRLAKKRSHWQGVIIAACEQSGRTVIPEILAPMDLETFVKNRPDDLCVAMLPQATTKLRDLKKMQNLKSVTLLIGPEGGFSPEEERMMLAASVQGINLGKRILRAETAVVAGLTACQQEWGDL